MLCKICNNLQHAPSEKDLKHTKPIRRDDIFDSYINGCAGCELIYRLCPTDSDEVLVHLDERLKLESCHLAHRNSWTIVPFTLREPSCPLVPVYSVRTAEAPTITSTIPRIQKWLGECETSHKSCGPTAKEPLLPTRVIDVGSAHVHPKLHVSQPNERAAYCALSHCWGPNNPSAPRLATIKDNFKQHCIKIAFESLPKTFRDAVEVVRALGIQYLWIDSLCIIQGDAADWAHQASLMADVYTYATLVIAADWSPNGSGGLFHEQTAAYNSLEAILNSFTYEDSSGTTHEIFGRENTGQRTDHATASVYPCFNHHNKRKLHERAWCLQERALATRTVFFCDVEVLWECRGLDTTICQCGVSVPRGEFDHAVAPIEFIPGIYNNRDVAGQGRSAIQPAEKWRNVVHAYTRRQMTHNTDRLPAIGGLARRFGGLKSTYGTYIAGFWHTDAIAEDLTWFNPHGFNEAIAQRAKTIDDDASHGSFERLPPSYAPSWSWASVAAPVTFERNHYMNMEKYFKADWNVVGISHTLASEDPYGPVSSALLTLSCYLIPVVDMSLRTVITVLDDIIGPDCPVSWDAGSAEDKWDPEAFEHAVLVARWQHKFFSGLIVKRPKEQEPGKAYVAQPWRRIGCIWDSNRRNYATERELECQKRQDAWKSMHPRVDVVLE